jgi:putative toxin-antitoxin system antitoxin component (TIGR02293 family)
MPSFPIDVHYEPSAVRQGLPYRTLHQFVTALGLTLADAAGLLLISERTLARRHAEGRLTQAESDRLVRLERLAADTVEAFDGHAAEAKEWLTTPKALLGGESPLRHADTEPGLRAVRQMLAVIQHNVAA